LPAKAAPEAIPAARNVVLRLAGTDAAGAGGAGWPITETARTTQIVRVYDPHDATRFIDIEQATTVTFDDVDGTERVMVLTP
jgi:hypothetical protein